MATQLTLILGGIASGKSARAEAMARSTGEPLIYLATAQAGDAEMAEKIKAHIAARGPGWHTIEAPLDAAGVLHTATPGHTLLFDCATMWLANHMQAGSDIEAETETLIAALKTCPCAVIVVSNELGLGGVPENALARRFANAQGRLNQQLAAAADCVELVAAGLPLTLKGEA